MLQNKILNLLKITATKPIPHSFQCLALAQTGNGAEVSKAYIDYLGTRKTKYSLKNVTHFLPHEGHVQS